MPFPTENEDGSITLLPSHADEVLYKEPDVDDSFQQSPFVRTLTPSTTGKNNNTNQQEGSSSSFNSNQNFSIPKRIPHSHQFHLRTILNKLILLANEMHEQAMQEIEPIDQAILNVDFKKLAIELWDYKDARNREWQLIFQPIHVMVQNPIFDFLSQKKCLALKNVLNNYLLPIKNLSIDDIDEAMNVLEEAGIETTYIGLSHDD